MKHISILIPEGFTVLESIVNTYGMLALAQVYLNENDKREQLPIVEMVGLSKTKSFYNGAVHVTPHKLIHEVEKTDLIIIPAFGADSPEIMDKNRGFIFWIQNQREKYNTEIASIAVGAFLLAETGLIDQKDCASHWVVRDKFQGQYPGVNLKPGKMITEDNGIYTSGGGFSALNLVLYIIGKYWGKECEIYCSRLMDVEAEEEDKTHLLLFHAQKEHDDSQIKIAQDYIERNYQGKIKVAELAALISLSPRNFSRRFKKVTGNTPLEYVHRVKIEVAKKKLETIGEEHIGDIMYQLGYTDSRTFRTIFKRYTGMVPLEYKRKYANSVEGGEKSTASPAHDFNL